MVLLMVPRMCNETSHCSAPAAAKESAQDEEKGLWGMKGMKLPVSLKFPWQKDKATAGKK